MLSVYDTDIITVY